MRAAGYIIAAILIFFGVLFLMSARTEYTQNPGARIITGLVLIAVGIAITLVIRKTMPQPGQKIEIVQKIDLAGKSLPEQMKCRQCGAPLAKDTVSVKEGAVFINCPYCQSTYQITEEPKW
jgi:cytochrome c biogenesis protein CcdA